MEYRPRETSWNALECIEHLNFYGEFYLNRIDRAIHSSHSTPQSHFKPGWLGAYFAEIILPGKKPMKTAKDMNPNEMTLRPQVLERFWEQHGRLQSLIGQSAKVSLEHIRIETSLSPFIRLKLGDLLHFVINHNLRHLHQAEALYRQHLLRPD